MTQDAISNSFGAPGQRLRNAREAKNFLISDIAEQLHLNKRVIEALEEGRYKDVGPFIFVKGYMRSYARLVDINGDELIVAFNDLKLVEERPDDKVITLRREQMKVSNNRSMRWVSYLIAIILVGLVAAWWQSQKTTPIMQTESFSTVDSMVPSNLSGDHLPPINAQPENNTTSNTTAPVEEAPPADEYSINDENINPVITTESAPQTMQQQVPSPAPKAKNTSAAPASIPAPRVEINAEYQPAAPTINNMQASAAVPTPAPLSFYDTMPE